MMSQVTRRTALIGGCATIIIAAAPFQALAQARGPVSQIRVDVGPLRSTGANDVADWVNQALPDALRNSLARRWATSGGGTVVARISGVILRTNRSGQSRMGSSSRSRSQDSMEGDVSLLDASGREVAKSHLLATRQSPFSSTATTSAMRQRQVVDLSASFAHWTPRRLGL